MEITLTFGPYVNITGMVPAQVKQTGSKGTGVCFNLYKMIEKVGTGSMQERFSEAATVFKVSLGAMTKHLRELAKQKSFSPALQDTYEDDFPNVLTVKCAWALATCPPQSITAESG